MVFSLRPLPKPPSLRRKPALQEREPEPIRLNLRDVVLRGADLHGANLSEATFAGADCRRVNFRRSNFKDADFTGAKLQGADFTGARNLTWAQLDAAIIDDTTKLPDYLTTQGRRRAVE